MSSIDLVVHPSLDDVCNIQHPTTGLEAKFSLRATQAFAASGVDTTAVETYEDGPVNEPEIQKFLDLVTVGFEDGLTTTATRITITTTEGNRFEAFYDSGVPASDLAAQRDKLEAKFLGLVSPVLGGDRAAAVRARLVEFDRMAPVSVAQLLQTA